MLLFLYKIALCIISERRFVNPNGGIRTNRFDRSYSKERSRFEIIFKHLRVVLEPTYG